jgi:histone chaperone ASF1
MSKVQINNVVVLNNPATFASPFQFEITFDCMENLEDDLEWKLTYVGSAESSSHDQILDTIYVGPVPEGRHMFVFQVGSNDFKFLLFVSRRTRRTTPRSPARTCWARPWC